MPPYTYMHIHAQTPPHTLFHIITLLILSLRAVVIIIIIIMMRTENRLELEKKKKTFCTKCALFTLNSRWSSNGLPYYLYNMTISNFLLCMMLCVAAPLFHPKSLISFLVLDVFFPRTETWHGLEVFLKVSIGCSVQKALHPLLLSLSDRLTAVDQVIYLQEIGTGFQQFSQISS